MRCFEAGLINGETTQDVRGYIVSFATLLVLDEYGESLVLPLFLWAFYASGCIGTRRITSGIQGSVKPQNTVLRGYNSVNVVLF